MSNFTPLVKKQYKFEDDDVTVEFSRLKRKHVLTILPKAQEMERQDDRHKQTLLQNELLNEVLDILPDYVAVFTGLRDAAGGEIDFSSAVNEIYFIDLISDIAMDVIQESLTVEGASGKNG